MTAAKNEKLFVKFCNAVDTLAKKWRRTLEREPQRKREAFKEMVPLVDKAIDCVERRGTLL